MKIISDKIRFLLLLVLLDTGIISCSEDMEEVNDNAEVTFTTSLQKDVFTRAFGDGRSVDKLVIGVFDLNENDEYSEIEDLRHYEDIVDGEIGDITLTLAKSQTYHFVFWAYNSDGGIYNMDNLTAIKMKSDINGFAQAESADAFFATVKDFTVTANTLKKISLTRPLAQINVGTSGKAAKASFSVKKTADTFHPFTQGVIGNADFTWIFDEPSGEPFWVDDISYNYLAMGYVFAPPAETVKACELTLNGETKEFPEVALRANCRSNIVGNFTDKDTKNQ